MKVQITLITGQMVTFDEPPGFNLVAFATSIRESGRFLVDNCYIPADKIVSILRIDEAGKVDIRGLN